MPSPAYADLAALVPDAPGWRIDWSAIWALWPALPALDACPQDPIHHAEGDVGTHTRMVVAALVADPDWRALPEGDRATLFWAAVLHDVGKPATTAEAEGRITSRGHSRVGTQIAREVLWHARAPFAWREALCGIIAHHQLPFWLIERPDPTRIAIETSMRCRPDHLCLHARADAEGRICADKRAVLDHVALATATFEEAGCARGPYPFANDESRVVYHERSDRAPDHAAYPEHPCTVTMMSGLPGAGKDSWLAANRPSLPVVSLDRLRGELGIAPTDDQGRVVQAAQEAARAHLRAGRDFAWNATNTTRLTRAKVLRLLRAYGARVEIVYLEPAPRELMRRNGARSARVPDAVIARLAAKLEPPQIWEAHRVHHVVDEPC